MEPALVAELLKVAKAAQQLQYSANVEKFLKHEQGRTIEAEHRLQEELLLKALPDVTMVLNKVLPERREWEESQVQLFNKQTDHIQKIQRLEDIRIKVEQKAQEIHKLHMEQQEELDKCKARNERLEREALARTEELEQARDEAQQVREQVIRAKEDVTLWKEQLAKQHAELKSAQNMLEVYEKEKTRLLKENKRLRRSLEIITEQEEEVHDRLISNKQATTKLEENFATLESEAKHLRNELEQKQANESSLMAEQAARSSGKERSLSTKCSQTENCSKDDLRVLNDLLRDMRSMAQETSLVSMQLRRTNNSLRRNKGRRLASDPRALDARVPTSQTKQPIFEGQRHDGNFQELLRQPRKVVSPSPVALANSAQKRRIVSPSPPPLNGEHVARGERSGRTGGRWSPSPRPFYADEELPDNEDILRGMPVAYPPGDTPVRHRLSKK